MSINWADIAVASIILISVVLGLVRGFLRELLALLVWILAFVIAFVFTEPVAAQMEQLITNDPVRVLTAFSALFLAVMLVGGFVNYLVGKAIEKGGISGTDRLLGLIFGAARGGAVVLVLVMLAGFTAMSESEWWQDSRLLPWFEDGADWVSRYFPEDVLQHLPPNDQAST